MAQALLARRPLRGVFRFWAGILALAALAPPGAAGECPGERLDRRAGVVHVVDGDTLVLEDREHLRLIGIDTPELGRDGAADEPFARAARERVVALLGGAGPVGLRMGRETRDHHGRLLAHVYLPDGRNLQVLLLEAGLAVPLVVPPNLWAVECYAEAAHDARAAGRGLWGHPRLQPREAAGLEPGHRGLARVRGRVSRIGRSRHNLWLDLTPGFSLRVPREDLQYFAPGFPADIEGRRVEALGKVYRRSGQLRMTLRHPGALRLLD